MFPRSQNFLRSAAGHRRLVGDQRLDRAIDGGLTVGMCRARKEGLTGKGDLKATLWRVKMAGPRLQFVRGRVGLTDHRCIDGV